MGLHLFSFPAGSSSRERRHLCIPVGLTEQASPRDLLLPNSSNFGKMVGPSQNGCYEQES